MSLATLKPFNAPSLDGVFPFFGSPLKGFYAAQGAIFLTLSELMRGKVTADAYSGEVNCGRRFAVVACGEAARVGGTWRDDDWEVTRPRVTTAH